MPEGTFVIVDDVAEARRLPQVWRLPVTLLGLFLVLAGILGFVPVMFVLGSTLFFWRLDGKLDLAEDPNLWLWVVGLVVASYVVMRIGIRLLRGRRQSALFLRRFGFTDATRVLSRAVTRGLGRRWRLITLDDLRVAAVGVGGRGRRFVRVGPWVLGLALLVLVVWVLPPWFDARFDEGVSEAVDKAVASAEEQGANPIAAVFGAAITALVVGVVMGLVLMLVTLVPVALGGSLTLFGFGAGRAWRRAEGRRAVHVDEPDQIEPVVRRVEKATTRIYAPRLTVVRCAQGVWQPVVRRFADLTDVTLIDVSEASPGLLWELTELWATLSTTWVLVGRKDRLGALLVDSSPEAIRLRTLLDGQSVLAYRIEEPRRFEHALRARLTRVR